MKMRQLKKLGDIVGHALLVAIINEGHSHIYLYKEIVRLVNGGVNLQSAVS